MSKQKITLGLIVALGVFLTFVISIRFLLLDYSPPGFFVDEAGSAAHIMCLKDTGKNCHNQRFPLYSTTWGVGRMGPMHQYVGWAWVEVLGGSIASLRMISAVFGVFTIIALFSFAYLYGGKSIAICTLLSSLLLPWGFHSSRIAWDPPLAPFFVILTVFFLFISSYSRQWYFSIFLGALCVVLGSATYPPVMAHFFFFFILLFVFQRYIFKVSFGRWVVFGVLCLIGIACFRAADTSAVEGRVSEVSIWGTDPRNPTAGGPLKSKITQFAKNTAKHFEPDYLFFKGEFNLRHTTSQFGIFSWLDLFSLLIAPLLFFIARRWKKLRAEPEIAQRMQQLALLGFIGYLSASMAAALTWDSLPHGLRSLSGWPFAALFSGVLLSYTCKHKLFRYLTVVVIFTYCFSFGRYYFGDFRREATWWFDTDVTDALNFSKQSGNEEEFRAFLEKRQYPSLAREYYFRQYFSQQDYP